MTRTKLLVLAAVLLLGIPVVLYLFLFTLQAYSVWQASRTLDRLEALGYDVVRWRRRNLFFGGAAAVEVLPDGVQAAAGDPRRGGAGVLASE